MTSKLPMFFALSLALIGGVVSCQEEQSKPLSPNDTLAVRVAVMEIRQNGLEHDLDSIRIILAAQREWIDYADSVISDRQWKRDRAGRRGEFLGNLGVAIGIVKKVK